MEMLLKGCELPVIRWKSSEDLMHGMVIVPNRYCIIHLKVAKRVNVKCFIKKKLIICDDGGGN